jgi:hypothetical protein
MTLARTSKSFAKQVFENFRAEDPTEIAIKRLLHHIRMQMPFLPDSGVFSLEHLPLSAHACSCTLWHTSEKLAVKSTLLFGAFFNSSRYLVGIISLSPAGDGT